MDDGRLLVQRLGSGAGVQWAGATGIAVVGMFGLLWVPQPAERWAVVVVAVVGAVAVAAIGTRRTWVEPAAGTVVRETFWVLRRRVALRTARIRLVCDRHGGMHIAVGDLLAVHVPVLLSTPYARRVQQPEVLRLVADQIIRYAPHARDVAIQLRHLASSCAGPGP